MGEVYRARDTRLDRLVAIKVLPSHLADAPDLQERFEREARAVAALNHPHICTLHDVGRQDGTAFLVMEHLEGETLAARLEKGALPVDQALQYAIQIADALDKAHSAGIVHRDLKPANIMLVRTGAKLLDFGLAKSTASLAPAGLSMLPTTPPGLTAQGAILGTFQYMAPEQLEGQDADLRTDVFAFGLVVYEMVTGRRAFEGKSQASLIAAIMHVQPPAPSTMAPLTPSALDLIVTKCLEKDPHERWQSAKDLRDTLEWCSSGRLTAAGIPKPVRSRTRALIVSWTTAAVALTAALLLAGMRVYESRPPAPYPVRFSVAALPGTTFLTPTAVTPVNQMAQAVSPDGRHVAFLARRGADPASIWIRSLASLDTRLLAGTEGAAAPFWSSDSQSLGFFASGKLKRVNVNGGSPVTLADAPNAAGGTWSRDGTILFSPNLGKGLYRMPAAGSEPVLVSLPAIGSEKAGLVRWPVFLPDGRHFLFFALPDTIAVGSLDSTEGKKLLQADSHAVYASGYLLFQRQGTLLAQPFDTGRLELTGEAIPVAEQLGIPASAFGRFSVSNTGVLVHRSDAEFSTELRWFDRQGTSRGTVGPESLYINPVISPDGSQVMVGRRDRNQPTFDLWLFDLARNLSSRLTFDPGNEWLPLWSPDRKYIAYTMDRRTGKHDLYRRLANGAGEDELVFTSDYNKNLTDWTPDGQFLFFDEATDQGTNVTYVAVSGAKGTPYLQGPFNEQNGHVSPDGRWIAYQSDESGRFEIYVRPFPNAEGGKWQISNTGGMDPRWVRGGKELLYFSGDDTLSAATVVVDASGFRATKTEPLFRAARTANRTNYGVTADGQRFLINVIVEAANGATISVVLNWPQTLRP
jgi:Tol biopolymer transport system component